MGVVLLIYILSLAPVGRLYITGWLDRDTWHENALRTFYAPLLYPISQSEALYQAQLNYSNLWKGGIPKIPEKIYVGAVIPQPVFSRSLSWWYMARLRAFTPVSTMPRTYTYFPARDS